MHRWCCCVTHLLIFTSFFFVLACFIVYLRHVSWISQTRGHSRVRGACNKRSIMRILDYNNNNKKNENGAECENAPSWEYWITTTKNENRAECENAPSWHEYKETQQWRGSVTSTTHENKCNRQGKVRSALASLTKEGQSSCFLVCCDMALAVRHPIYPIQTKRGQENTARNENMKK